MSTLNAKISAGTLKKNPSHDYVNTTSVGLNQLLGARPYLTLWAGGEELICQLLAANLSVQTKLA